MKRLIVILLLACLLATFACAAPPQPLPTPTPAPPTTKTDGAGTEDSPQPTAAGRAIVREILDSLEEDRVLLPPSGGEQPRILTEAEKARIMEIASSAPQVMEVMRNPDLAKVGAYYLWIGRSNGTGFLHHKPIEDGIKDVSDHPNTYYPAVSFIFAIKFDENSRCGIHVAVDLETGTVVYVGGFDNSELPRKKLPP